MIGVIDITLNCQNPNFPIVPVFSFVNSPQNFRIKGIPKKILDWEITNVFITLYYPDNSVTTTECLKVNDNLYIATVGSTSTSGVSTNGVVITANGKDEYGSNVTNYVLGVGNLYIKELDGSISPGSPGTRMILLDDVPSTPKNGEVYEKNGSYVVVQNNTENTLGGVTKNYVDGQINIVRNEIPTKTSELTNDSGFITSADVPTKTSDLTNDSGFITSADVPTKTSDLTNDSGFITSSDVPTKTSDLTNDSGFITSGDLRYELYDVPANLQLKDRAINYKSAAGVATSFTFVLPSATSSTKCRDFMLFFNIPTTVTTIPTVSFSGITICYVDGDTFPRPDSNGAWLYSFTEVYENNFAVSLKKLTKVLQ